nr:hypothetical protein [Labilibaculum sp.]
MLLGNHDSVQILEELLLDLDVLYIKIEVLEESLKKDKTQA